MSDFAGFPVAALDFYDDLEVDNTKSYWEKHKATYAECVKAPMTALCAALAPEFGRRPKVFRPYRDVRFAKDKTPYKTHQGAFVAAGPATGWYVEVSARGCPHRRRLLRGELRRGWPRSARPSTTTAPAPSSSGSWPRWTPTAGRSAATGSRPPRAGTTPTTRGSSCCATSRSSPGHSHGFEPVIHTPELLDLVRDDWRALRPLVEWVADHAE